MQGFSGFEKWKLLKCDCHNMPCESFDRNSLQIKTGKYCDNCKIAIYDQGYGEKRVKVAVIMGHFKQILHTMSVISLSKLLQIKK